MLRRGKGDAYHISAQEAKELAESNCSRSYGVRLLTRDRLSILNDLQAIRNAAASNASLVRTDIKVPKDSLPVRDILP